MARRKAKLKQAVASAADTRTERAKPLRPWVTVATLLAVVGVVVAVFAARSVSQTDAERSDQAFTQNSGQIASTLQLAIQHEQDLIIGASGFIAGNPHASNLQFSQWATSVHALARYPELIGFGHSVIVPAADLSVFEARATIDPVGPLSPNGTFQVVPSGTRQFYCLSVSGVWRNPKAAFPAGFDYCAGGGLASATLSSRDSGLGHYLPFKADLSIYSRSSHPCTGTELYRPP